MYNQLALGRTYAMFIAVGAVAGNNVLVFCSFPLCDYSIVDKAVLAVPGTDHNKAVLTTVFISTR